MKLIDAKCPYCGAALKVDSDNKNATCEYCGASLILDDEVHHVQYDNAEQAGYEFEKGRQRAQAEAMNNYGQVYTQQYVEPPRKRRRTWLWILGWICIFPLPLTILLLRKKNMNPAIKYGIIAVAWLVYFSIGYSRKAEREAEEAAQNTDVSVVEYVGDVIT